MRLWHKDLIPVLPRQQLLGQWRECCCIARNIAANGTPNHMLVNKIMDYPLCNFYTYARAICAEMNKRGYKCSWEKFDSITRGCQLWYGFLHYHWVDEIFKDWHNDRYLMQCWYNLQEKYDCGGISEGEWRLIVNFVRDEYGKFIY